MCKFKRSLVIDHLAQRQADMEAAGKKVTIKRIEEADHAFDKQPVAWKEGTKENERREEMYGFRQHFHMTCLSIVSTNQQGYRDFHLR